MRYVKGIYIGNKLYKDASLYILGSNVFCFAKSITLRNLNVHNIRLFLSDDSIYCLDKDLHFERMCRWLYGVDFFCRDFCIVTYDDYKYKFSVGCTVEDSDIDMQERDGGLDSIVSVENGVVITSVTGAFNLYDFVHIYNSVYVKFLDRSVLCFYKNGFFYFATDKVKKRIRLSDDAKVILAKESVFGEEKFR